MYPDTKVNVMGGLMIHEDPNLTIPESKTVDRTWFERLFSWPWTPMQTTKVIVEHKPDPNVYNMGHMMVMHPAVAQELKRQMNEQEKEKDHSIR